MSTPNDRQIPEIREEIDKIDSELVRILNRRAELAQEIGRAKGETEAPFFTPERERQIYERIREMNPGPLTPTQLRAVFVEIISAARAAERRLRIAFWGPEGTFTHAAARATFGVSSDLFGYDTISEVFLAVEHGKADYGVVPVENSVAGIVPETLDMFPQTNVRICSEVYIPIAHHLVGNCSDIQKIERIYAGPQPGSQCRRWLRIHAPSATLIDCVPTARAVAQAAGDPQGAAIANRLAAELNGVPIVSEHIEDNPNNRTRFWVIGYNEPAKTGRDKTSLMFSLRNRPGELYRALGAFENKGVNLLMIESRPGQRTSFEYIFFVDCEGHRTDNNFIEAVNSLRQSALETTVLGSYPAAKED